MTNMNDIVRLSPEMVLDELIIEMYDAMPSYRDNGNYADELRSLIDFASDISEMFDFHVSTDRVMQTLRAYTRGRN